MEDNTDADYAQAKRVCKDFEIKHLGVFENFKNMCLKISELVPANFFQLQD